MPLGVEQLVRGVVSRARRGLYGGRTILSGNKVSEDGKNKCGPFCACPTSQSNSGPPLDLPVEAALVHTHQCRLRPALIACVGRCATWIAAIGPS